MIAAPFVSRMITGPRLFAVPELAETGPVFKRERDVSEEDATDAVESTAG